MNYIVPAETTRIELKFKNSRFIATAGYSPTVEDAKAFIATVKKEFSDASHNVPAYIVGNGASVIEHCNDDGEPSGTAGRPMLAVLKGSGFGDITVVVARYFGGTKLGTGGLVKAYGQSAKEVLHASPRARKTMIVTLKLEMPYSNYEPVKRVVEGEGGSATNEVFAADVSFEAAFELERCQQFRTIASERWPTSVTITELGEAIGTIAMGE